MATRPQEFTLRVDIDQAEIDKTVACVATTFAVQIGEDGVLVTLLQASPIVTVGSPEEQRAQIQKAGSVKTNVLGRFSLTPKRVRELSAILIGTIKALEEHEKS